MIKKLFNTGLVGELQNVDESGELIPNIPWFLVIVKLWDILLLNLSFYEFLRFIKNHIRILKLLYKLLFLYNVYIFFWDFSLVLHFLFVLHNSIYYALCFISRDDCEKLQQIIILRPGLYEKRDKRQKIYKKKSDKIK